MKKLLITLLFAAGLLTACTTVLHAAENAGKAILGINPCQKEITVQAVTADGSPVQVEGCTVTEFPSGEKTVLTATGTKVVLKGALIELFCYANKLTALDVRGLTALQELYCQNNMLTSLDVRELTGLHTLYCGNNRLTALDIHGLTALQNLYCNDNEIASLDVRGLTALQALHCDNNRLTSLNVQGLTALQLLVCSDNQLTALNVQGLPALQILDCSSNRLTSLDVHALTALKGLYCQDNKLTSLDVRELIGLRTLFCNDNRLTALNVHRLTALQELDCSSNAIASIDVRGLTGLCMLYCDNNRLTSLDVQGLTALQLLVCSDNQLTALNVQSLPALQALVFQHNRLEEDALIRILNSLPDRKTDEEAEAVFYTEEDNRSEGNYTDWSSSAGLQAAIKTARAKNWTLYKQVGGEDFEELEVTEEAERGTHSGSAAVPTDKTYTVKSVSFTMKGITAVTDAVLGDNSMEDNQEHSVNLSAYHIGETEVTQELWQAVMGASNKPSYFDGTLGKEADSGEKQEKRPVEQVRWFDCIAFCNELTKKAGLGDSECVYYSDAALSTVYTMSDANSYMVPQVKWGAKGFRLPTEAEWEWAAKGGKEYRWAGTDEQDELKKYAWYAWYDDSDGGDAKDKTHEVKKKQANGYGLYDMSGNVWEWCWDWYDDNTPDGGQQDPTGPTSGSSRVHRGGSWDRNADNASRAYRVCSFPDEDIDNLGLRVVCSVGR